MVITCRSLKELRDHAPAQATKLVKALESPPHEVYSIRDGFEAAVRTRISYFAYNPRISPSWDERSTTNGEPASLLPEGGSLTRTNSFCGDRLLCVPWRRYPFSPLISQHSAAPPTDHLNDNDAVDPGRGEALAAPSFVGCRMAIQLKHSSMSSVLSYSA
ncbi:uncharacterized protein LACBIDRAFT_333483 [Laccaria bicolor S238N-H82]|uniref:Predicted protein n=1 Tax=Laccaria bicolor (strain S238N-H82 / ATCC MYA-4686) TaxID=486041 RepID=B0DW25_LACBS|nr:uncharacterized protein LACBIDRAFT_333483 [Laccaria bicolor S238N-H82]EDR01238.1 predicted protein [Laccaria bicolor S238N-H82]|eukprot:XP_001888114.1 predicted protein [Laccaria bicolor S238N-H82]